MYKEYLNKIDFATHKAKLIDVITMLMEDADDELYDHICNELYIMAYGKKLTEEKARRIIQDMKPYGLHWSLEETKQVQTQHGLTSIDPISFWIVMNSAYNDYHDVFGDDVTMYAKYTRAFIQDQDAVEDKVFVYFMKIPK